MSTKLPRRNVPPLEIEWQVDEVLEETVNRDLLRRALSEALVGRILGRPLVVGLTITDDRGIQELNRLHRGMDSPTDVLSFPMLEYEAPERPKSLFPQPPGQQLHLGDIVISHQRAVEQAGEYGHSLDRELAFLAVHGAMHLLGYDHEVPEEQARMRREEEAILRRLGLSREQGDG